MTDRHTLQEQTRLHYYSLTVKNGINALKSPCTSFLFGLVLALVFAASMSAYWTSAPLDRLFTFLCAVCCCLLSAVVFLYVLGYRKGAWKYCADFQRAGFTNSVGEAPFLVARSTLNERVVQLTFFCKGLPLQDWQDAKKNLETALNLYIAKIAEGPDRRTMVLTCVPPDVAFPYAAWQDAYTHRNDDAIIVLGKGLLDEVITNIDVIPHILIGGSTGSGKTVLLKTILWQMILQADVVYIADFKGGVDYPQRWHTFAHLVTEEQAFLQLLERLAAEIESRKAEFNRLDVQNIKEYRHKTHDYMQRIVVACDEVAELLDKTGANKERKETIDKIAAALSLVARQGRAFGVHLVLATQRPDANVIPAQVKSNIGTRICGRADATLSTIILGDGKADEEIPKDAQGRFILEDGTVFQGYYFDDTTD